MEAVTTAASRWLDLDGAANARDLGGLPLEGGGTTAAGVVLRSDNLQDLTPADVRRLVDDLGVAVVVDLRTGAEVELEGPGRSSPTGASRSATATSTPRRGR